MSSAARAKLKSGEGSSGGTIATVVQTQISVKPYPGGRSIPTPLLH